MDIISDILDRVADAIGLPDEVRDMIEGGIRQDWRGERPYIAANPDGRMPQAQSARNRAIIRDWRNGERVPLLARKYGISRQRVWQIIKG